MIRIAGMNSIPREIIEAAHMDGAGYYRRLFQIVLPLLLPVISVTVLFSVLFTFTDMTVVWVLTKGGPPPHATTPAQSKAAAARAAFRRTPQSFQSAMNTLVSPSACAFRFEANTSRFPSGENIGNPSNVLL